MGPRRFERYHYKQRPLLTSSSSAAICPCKALGSVQGSKPFCFRRGSTGATIQSLAFSPSAIQPPLLCATSNHGTVQIFRVEAPARFLLPLLCVKEFSHGVRTEDYIKAKKSNLLATPMGAVQPAVLINSVHCEPN